MSVTRSLPKHIFLALALALPLAAFAQTNPPSPTPAPSVAPSTSPSPSPSPISVTPSPSATPSTAPTISPSPEPTSLPTPLVLPPRAAPQILAVTVNEVVFHSGDTIYSTVITSTNVAAVELRVAGRAIRYPRIDFGIFQLVYKVPHVPRRMLHDYNAQIVAMNAYDMYVARSVVISLR